MTKPPAFGSFGRPAPDEIPEPDPRQSRAEMPTPNVGEFYAELRLVLTEDTLSELGSQIASMISAATRQGFEHGMVAAMDRLAGDDEDGDDEDDEDAQTSDFLTGTAPIPGMSDTDLARARGQSA